MQLAAMSAWIWLLAACAVRCGYAEAGGSTPVQGEWVSLASFRVLAGEILSGARAWSGEHVMGLVNANGGMEFARSVFTALANLAYMQWELEMGDAEIAILENELMEARGSDIPWRTSSALGRYYDFTVGSLGRLLRKYSHGLASGVTVPKFEEIPTLTLVDLMEDRVQVVPDSCRTHSRLNLHSVYFDQFVNLIVKRYREFNHRVRESAYKVNELSHMLGSVDAYILAYRACRSRLGGAAGEGHEECCREVDWKIQELEGEKQRIESRIASEALGTRAIIETSDRSKYTYFLNSEFYESLQCKFSTLFDEDMIRDLTLQPGYVFSFLLSYTKRNLAILALHVKRHSDISDCGAVLRADLEFVRCFRESRLVGAPMDEKIASSLQDLLRWTSPIGQAGHETGLPRN